MLGTLCVWAGLADGRPVPAGGSGPRVEQGDGDAGGAALSGPGRQDQAGSQPDQPAGVNLPLGRQDQAGSQPAGALLCSSSA